VIDLSATATAATTDREPFSPKLEEGIRIAIEQQERGQESPLTDWLAKHPEYASELARFLAAERDVSAAVTNLGTAFDPIGKRIGKYELREKIGKGGMGVVYRAYDAALKRDVALKCVSAATALTATELAKFQFEAELIASLNHPSIVRVHDFGESHGVPYLVMPLLEGGSLSEWLKALGPDRCLPPLDAAEKVRDIALAVHHAHQRGVIHRDLKPGNVLRDGQGRLYVSDFGLARKVDESHSGGIAGTAAYMAPEQARGEKVLTVAVDIHALGAILFELLSGEPPYGKGEYAAIIRRVGDWDDPPPLVTTIRTGVPADLEYVCQKCLEKNPAERYPSAQSLVEDLNRILGNEPVDRPRSNRLLAFIWRAVGRRRETASMATWPIAFWGALCSTFGVGCIQLAVLFSDQRWVHHACLAGYSVGWLGVIWFFWIRKRGTLNTVERGSLAINLGMFFGAVCMISIQLWMHHGDVLPVFPPLTALLGLGVFAHGLTYWGRLYIVGLLAFAVAALTPVIPRTYWPTAYGLTFVLGQFWVAGHLRRYHREARAAAERLRNEVTALS
jgi:serine/threonine-protein kinase